MKTLRIATLLLTTGIIWCLAMRTMFIWSGAQNVLADPARQSGKFLKVFMEYEPLPVMATDSMILWKGFFVCGLLAAAAFLLVNRGLKGSWLKRGLIFGLLHWLLMTPWFEFYLPYNVMHEPLLLVSFEALLWLITLQLTALYMSFILNFKNGDRSVHKD